MSGAAADSAASCATPEHSQAELMTRFRPDTIQVDVSRAALVGDQRPSVRAGRPNLFRALAVSGTSAVPVKRKFSGGSAI
jgi:hypothetical protein